MINKNFFKRNVCHNEDLHRMLGKKHKTIKNVEKDKNAND